jgi:hypothetical protein
MNEIICVKCGMPAAFLKDKTEPWTCLQCQDVEQPESAAAEKPKAVSSSDFVLLPASELKRLLCKCGAPMGADGHADVYDLDGKTAVAEVRCAKCEEALGKR